MDEVRLDVQHVGLQVGPGGDGFVVGAGRGYGAETVTAKAAHFGVGEPVFQQACRQRVDLRLRAVEADNPFVGDNLRHRAVPLHVDDLRCRQGLRARHQHSRFKGLKDNRAGLFVEYGPLRAVGEMVSVKPVKPSVCPHGDQGHEVHIFCCAKH